MAGFISLGLYENIHCISPVCLFVQFTQFGEMLIIGPGN